MEKRRQATVKYIETIQPDKVSKAFYLDGNVPTVRELSFYQYSVLKLLPKMENYILKVFRGKIISSFEDLVNEMGMSKYLEEIEYDEIRIFIADMYTAIPYLILESEAIDADCKLKTSLILRY